MEWKAVKGYEGLYEVSENGDVRSLDREEIQPEKIRNGVVIKSFKRFRKGTQLHLNWDRRKHYYLVELNKNGIRKGGVHRLVYEAFIGDLIDGYIVHHIDNNKVNNHYSNLTLLSHTEHNNIHAHPSWNKGIKNPPEMIENARRAREKSFLKRCERVYNLRNSGLTWKEISNKLCISRGAANNQFKRYKDSL